MQTQTAKKPWIGAGRFDQVASTFKHIITLDTRKKGIMELQGYSKGLVGIEGPDKTIVLEREILRLVNAGYLFGKTKKYGDKTVKMDFFLNGQYTGITDELIFSLYPDEYIFASNQDYVQNIRLNTFFKRLYSQVKEGKLVTKSLMHKPTSSTVDELFDVTKYNFKTEPELYAWIEDRRRDGHPDGRVWQFYIEYRKKLK